MTHRTALFATLCAALLGAACNRHEVNVCLPDCGEGVDDLFAICVAEGGGPDDCRPGNRECCALSLGCIGEIGDQIVETTASCNTTTVPQCAPPCDLLPSEALALFEQCVTSGASTCTAGDEECCLSFLSEPCVGVLGELVIEGPDCCLTDDECADEDLCAGSNFACTPAACVVDDPMSCPPNRVCMDDACKCLDEFGTPVVHCPDGQLCQVDGHCGDPCDPDDAESCGPEAVCRYGYCFPDFPCETDDECGAGLFCGFGGCEPCRRDLPDLCDGLDTDCDGSLDEDCPMPGCGNGVIDDGEMCDGDLLDGLTCEDFGLSPAGTLLCSSDCLSFFTDDCLVEICDNELDDDLDEAPDCDDEDCFLHPFCCEPSPEICDGFDDDCDGVVDNDCTPLEICNNRIDDDGDLAVDCEDDDCLSDPACSCVPTGTADLCDGIDDDCDGTIGEDDTRPGTGCGSDIPPCSVGTYSCTGGELVCSGVEPQPELCNDVDDDCDMVVDNAREADADCDNGLFCDGVEFCAAGGSCVGDGTTPCFDDNECTDDLACDEAAGCLFTPEPADTPCFTDFVCDGSGVCILS